MSSILSTPPKRRKPGRSRYNGSPAISRWPIIAGRLWLLARRRTAHPYSILAAAFNIEHRLVGQGEQARTVSGVFRIGGDTEACLNMHLQTSICQKLRLAQRPPHLFGFVQRLPLAQAWEDNHELVAPVAHAKGRRTRTLSDRRGDLLQGLGPVEMPVR